MHVVATFEHSIKLEVALARLELSGVRTEDIFIIPLAPKLGQKRLFDTIHRSDGIGFLGLPAVLSTLFSVLGVIYGYVLAWGPVIWGLIGMTSGWCIGLLVNLLLLKKRMARKRLVGNHSEVVLLISCSSDDQCSLVENILYEHNAIGIGKVER